MASFSGLPAGGDRDRGPAFATTIIVFTVAAAITVMARLYVRLRVVKQLGIDDIFILLTLVSVAFLVIPKQLGFLTPLTRLSAS